MSEEIQGYKDKKGQEFTVDKPSKSKYKYYEEHIKGGLLTQPQIFDSDNVAKETENKVMIFEKAIMRSKCIMDCMLLDSNGTVIGLEIKTERDSTQRLKKQLYMYSLVCKYVYVVCHDDFIDKVEKILKRHKFGYVGIISYINFKDKPTFGKYKDAEISPNRSPYHTLDILWKAEIIELFNNVRSVKAKNKNSAYVKSTSQTKERKASINHNLTKPQVITNMINVLGKQSTYTLFSRAMIYGVKNSEKIVDKYQFISLEGDKDV